MARSELELFVEDTVEFFRLPQGDKKKIYFAALRSKKYFGMQNLYDSFSYAKQVAHDKTRDEGFRVLMWSLKTKEIVK